MIDLSDTILANSDQLTAIDLLSGDKVIKITDIKKIEDQKQTVLIFYEGDGGKPWKPCKGMRRCLGIGWSLDGSKYIGRSVKIFRNPKVLYSGKELGGIQIRAMSDIPAKFTTFITICRGKVEPITIEKLEITSKPAPAPKVETPVTLSETDIAELKELGFDAARNGPDELATWKKSLTGEQKKALGAEFGEKLTAIANDTPAL